MQIHKVARVAGKRVARAVRGDIPIVFSGLRPGET
jgi:FlaA1/EpsC-like NDP-sugar epimerase